MGKDLRFRLLSSVRAKKEPSPGEAGTYPHSAACGS